MMSVENGKVCCNCRHCIRVERPHEFISTYCEIDGMRYIGYVECMEGWCRHWAKERKEIVANDLCKK